MISKEELDSLRQYLKCKGVADLYNSDWYSLNGLEIRIDTECGTGVVFVYMSRDRWLIACTVSAYPRSNDNPHNVIVLDYSGLIRLIEGGEMAYNNMENEWILDMFTRFDHPDKFLMYLENWNTDNILEAL